MAIKLNDISHWNVPSLNKIKMKKFFGITIYSLDSCGITINRYFFQNIINNFIGKQMATTVKHITIALTKEDLKTITDLMEKLGETQTNVIKRALSFYKFYLENKNE